MDTSTPLDKNSRCSSGLCRSTDNKCGCTSTDHCDSDSSEVCHSDNKCYSSELTYEDDCSADNGDDIDARCTSGFCRTTDDKCGCTIDDHCSSSEVCHTDNKCYISGLSYEQDCAADNGDALNSRCASGFCRTTDNKCGCSNNSHCESNEVCYSEHCVLAPSTSPTKEVI